MLIGDADQLPSVGAGYVLNDIIESGRFSSVCLKEIFRQAQTSLIVRNAHAINNGEYPDLTVKNGDFFFLRREDERSIAPTVTELISSRLPKTYGEDIKKSIQVITPSHKGAAGTDNLNALLQNALNPPEPFKAEKKVRDVVFRAEIKLCKPKITMIFHGIEEAEKAPESSTEISVKLFRLIITPNPSQLTSTEELPNTTLHSSMKSNTPTRSPYIKVREASTP